MDWVWDWISLGGVRKVLESKKVFTPPGRPKVSRISFSLHPLIKILLIFDADYIYLLLGVQGALLEDISWHVPFETPDVTIEQNAIR